MTKRVQYQGVTTSDLYLRVMFEYQVGGSIRFEECKVPLGDLLAKGVMEALDKTIRRRLIEQWSAELEGPGLF